VDIIFIHTLSAIQRKLRLFGHICRTEDNRKLKILMFGIVDGTNKKRQAM